MSLYSHLPTLPALLFISSQNLAKSLIKYYIFTAKQELVPNEKLATKSSHLLLKIALMLETKLVQFGTAGFEKIGFSYIS